MNIGLTGGIASGKSTVSAFLVQLGAALIDADQIAREVVLPGSPVLDQVISRFGQAVISADGVLNRKKLGEMVFADPHLRKQLEQISHPAIRTIMIRRMSDLELADQHRLIVVDVPLLYESGLQTMFREVMVVYVPEEVQVERLMKRDGLSKQQAQERIQAQMPIDQKKQLADIIIDNSGTPEWTREQVLQFWHRKEL